MKTLAYCWACDKEQDITNIEVNKHGVKCKCGGYIISPSGRTRSKFVPESDEDKKLLGIEVEKVN